MDVQGNI